MLLADEGVLPVLMVVIPSRAGTRRAAVTVSGRAPQVERGHVFRNIVAAVERVERVVRLARLPVVVVYLGAIAPHLCSFRALVVRSNPLSTSDNGSVNTKQSHHNGGDAFLSDQTNTTNANAAGRQAEAEAEAEAGDAPA